MKAVEKDYNIHDIVTFRVVDQNNFLKKLLSYIDVRYKNFESKNIDKPDFTVYLGNFTPSKQDCCILDDKFYVKKDYFYCRDSRKVTKWEFEMRGFESGHIEAYIHTNLYGSLSVLINIIDFLIHFKINEKGFPLVHASCISKNNNAFLFSARSGGGKTTIAQYFVKKGFDFLGDNYIILHRDEALSFLSPLNIFKYNLTSAIKKNFRLKNKVILDLNYVLYKITLGYIKIATQVNPKELFPEQTIDKSKLNSIMFLMPGPKLNMKNSDKKGLIDYLVTNQKLEFFHLPFFRYELAYSYMFPDSRMSIYWEDYKENLKKSIGDEVSIFMVEIPQKYDTKVIEEINRLIATKIEMDA